jgi:hypothetical protein
VSLSRKPCRTPAKRSLTSGGQPGRGSASVARRGLAADESSLFKALGNPRQAAAWLNDRFGQLRHAHASIGLLGQPNEKVVVGHRQVVLLDKLLAEVATQRERDPQHPAPCAQLGGAQPLPRR